MQTAKNLTATKRMKAGMVYASVTLVGGKVIEWRSQSNNYAVVTENNEVVFLADAKGIFHPAVFGNKSTAKQEAAYLNKHSAEFKTFGQMEN